MSLRSLCLHSMRILMLWLLPCIPWCCHLLHVVSCISIWKTLQTSLQVSIPHPRHHSSWTCTLLPFLLGYFVIDGRLCINDITQQCHLTRVCLRPLSLFGSLIILFFILDNSSSSVFFIFLWSSFFLYGSFRFIFMYFYWSESWTVITCSSEQAFILIFL